MLNINADGLFCCCSCREFPVNIGAVGKFKYICPTGYSRNADIATNCDFGVKRASFDSESESILDWNRCQVKQK